MKKRNNQITQRIQLILIGSFFLSCQSKQGFLSTRSSLIDQKYIYSRSGFYQSDDFQPGSVNTLSSIKSESTSESTMAIKVYRNILGPSLYSRCKWFPSDSRYADLAQAKCGSLQGAVMAISRFMYEEDSTRMGYPIVINIDHIESVDFPHECWF